ANRQLVGRRVGLHYVGVLPGQHVDPVVGLAAPDPDLAFVADLEHVITAVLARALLRQRPLVADDDAVATADRPAHLAESGADDDIVRGLPYWSADRHEPGRVARHELIAAPGDP